MFKYINSICNNNCDATKNNNIKSCVANDDDCRQWKPVKRSCLFKMYGNRQQKIQPKRLKMKWSLKAKGGLKRLSLQLIIPYKSLDICVTKRTYVRLSIHNFMTSPYCCFCCCCCHLAIFDVIYVKCSNSYHHRLKEIQQKFLLP